jgi:hypothetical protein
LYVIPRFKGSNLIINWNAAVVNAILNSKIDFFCSLAHVEGNLGHDMRYHADMIPMIMRKEYAITVLSTLGNAIN